MMKKLLKLLGIIVVILFGILAAAPFFLESKIDVIVQNYADKNLNADIRFADISLSLIKSFPNAEVHIKDLKIVNHAPFEGETFATGKDLSFKLPIKELFKGEDEPLIVNEIVAEELMLTLKTNSNGTNNYNILREKELNTNSTSSDNTGFSFNIQNYKITNSAFTYLNEENHVSLYLTEFNHQGQGIFSSESSQLNTTTASKISVSVDSTSYLSNNTIQLDALIDLDLENNIYTFNGNKALLNALPLEFGGYVKLVEQGQELDIQFNNPGSSFKDFLAVIPSAFSKNLEEVTTTGNFSVNGTINGLISDETIPAFALVLASTNASFKYPDLPKTVEDIQIDAVVKNETGLSKDTYVDINTLNFKIDDDEFRAEAHIKNLTDNIKVNANFDGIINLANIAKAYPIETTQQLKGTLTGKLNTSFDMDAVKNDKYQRIRNNGTIAIRDFVFSSKEMVNPIQINKATINFKPTLINLNEFEAVTGSSDISATGKLTNFLGFLLSDKKLQGTFNVTSNTFVVSDFMTEDEVLNGESEVSTNNESLKIPEFLDCAINANVKTVIYDNLRLENVDGKLLVEDQSAKLVNINSEVFDGGLIVDGSVNTQGLQPNFNMQLGMTDLNVSKAFEALKMLEYLAPIASVLQGKLNAKIDVSGLLDSNFSPELNTITGKAEAKILTEGVYTDNSAILSGINDKLNFINLKDLDLKEIAANLNFEDGMVYMQPFSISYKDIPIEIKGSHGFDNTLNYEAVFQVPASYLGSDINRLIGQINDSKVNQIAVPVTANIKGSFSKPQITTDLSNSVSTLTQQLIELQKQKLIDQGTVKVSDFLGGLLKDKKDKDSKDDSTKNKSSQEKIKSGAQTLLNNLLGEKKSDSSKKDKNPIKKD